MTTCTELLVMTTKWLVYISHFFYCFLVRSFVKLVIAKRGGKDEKY
ncbi:MAG: hypothetical protein AB1349_13535 [Elusimicrobiota bacterium]